MACRGGLCGLRGPALRGPGSRVPTEQEVRPRPWPAWGCGQVLRCGAQRRARAGAFFFFFLQGVGAVLGFAKEDLAKEVFVLSTPIPGFQAVPVLMEGLHTWVGVGLGEVRVR